MKKLLWLCVIGLCLGQTGCIGLPKKSIYKGNWLEIATADTPEMVTVYIDQDSIQVHDFEMAEAGQYVIVKTKQRYYQRKRSNSNNEAYWQRISTQYLDCQNQKFITKGYAYLDQKDAVVDAGMMRTNIDTKNSQDSTWKYIQAGSIGALMLEAVCKLAEQTK